MRIQYGVIIHERAVGDIGAPHAHNDYFFAIFSSVYALSVASRAVKEYEAFIKQKGKEAKKKKKKQKKVSKSKIESQVESLQILPKHLVQERYNGKNLSWCTL